jgi:hypothetical protein
MAFALCVNHIGIVGGIACHVGIYTSEDVGCVVCAKQAFTACCTLKIHAMHSVQKLGTSAAASGRLQPHKTHP